MTTTTTKDSNQILAIYSHKCALVMRMVDVAVRKMPEGWTNLVTTHGLNLTAEQVENHPARYDSGIHPVGGGFYEVVLDASMQKSLGLFNDKKSLGLFNIGSEWNQVYVAPSSRHAQSKKGGAL